MEQIIENVIPQSFSSESPVVSLEEFAKRQVDEWNNKEGDMGYIDCRKCKNKGYIMYLDEDFYEHLTECDCLKERKSMEILKKSGLGKLTEKCTLDSFTTNSTWQKQLKNSALKYLDDNSGKWFYIGGQSGCGKTHICTAISVLETKKGKSLKYVIWRELFHQLQSFQFDDEKYSKKLDEIKNVDVLYIDDFLKSFDEVKLKTELNFAFEVINSRYFSDKQTIISSELMIDRLTRLDDAISGRIIEKSGGFIIEIPVSKDKNFRLR